MDEFMRAYDVGKFYQFPKEIVLLYGLLPKFDSDCMILYAVLLDYSDEYGHAWPSRYRLTEDTGISERTIDRKLAILKEYGLIEVERRVDGDGNLYRIIPPLKVKAFLMRFPEAKAARKQREQQIEDRKRRDKARKRKPRET